MEKFLSLREAVKTAESSDVVAQWKQANKCYLYSAHINTTGPVDYWELNYYCPETAVAATFHVDTEVKQIGASPILHKEGDPRPLSLARTKPVHQAFEIAKKRAKGVRYKNIVLVVQQPHNKKNPVLIANFIATDLHVFNIRIDLVSQRVVSQQNGTLYAERRPAPAAAQQSAHRAPAEDKSP